MAVAPDTPAATSQPPDKASTPLANPLAAGAPAQSLRLLPSLPCAGRRTGSRRRHPRRRSARPTPRRRRRRLVAAAAPAAGETIALAFKDYSWTEVRDRDGRVILSGMNRGGTSQSVSGTPPLELVIGNASDVRVTYRGNPVDLAPHTRQNVARFKLP